MKSIYIGNLAYTTTVNDLMDLCQSHGDIQHINLVKNKTDGRSRGFAFVEYATSEQAESALKQLDGYQFQERPLTVRLANGTSKTAKPPTLESKRRWNRWE